LKRIKIIINIFIHIVVVVHPVVVHCILGLGLVILTLMFGREVTAEEIIISCLESPYMGYTKFGNFFDGTCCGTELLVW